MREIKFRAWDKTLSTITGRIMSWDELLRMNYAIKYLFASDMIELMQYTGLKDKNGKEIYEGDIVQFLGSGKKLISPVTFDSRGACILNDGMNARLDMLDPIPYEVIGNIYENRELLDAR